jgi:hypothetical protein
MNKSIKSFFKPVATAATGEGKSPAGGVSEGENEGNKLSSTTIETEAFSLGKRKTDAISSSSKSLKVENNVNRTNEETVICDVPSTSWIPIQQLR